MCYSFFWMVVFHRPNAVRFVQVIACRSDALLCISQENSTGRLYHSFVSPSPILARLKIKLRIAFTHKSLRPCIYFFWMNWGERLLALMFNFIQNPQLFPRGSCDVTSPSPVLKSRWKCPYPCCVLCLDTWRFLHVQFCHLWPQGVSLLSQWVCFISEDACLCWLGLSGLTMGSVKIKHPHLVPNLRKNGIHH